MKTCADCPTPIERPHARYCDACRWRHRGKPARYVWTPERDQVVRDRYDSHVRGRSSEIARALGFPKWAVTKRAARLGLVRPKEDFRHDWTAEDEAFLMEHVGTRHVRWIAKKLGRTEASVVMKLKHERVSRKVREGYTMRDLEACFGVDHRVITRWIDKGWLRATRRPEKHEDPKRNAYQVSDAAVLQFIEEHPLAFRLDRVDQPWFMDLVTGAGLIRKALALEQSFGVAVEADREEAA